jgi:hypothetical protein
MPILMDDDFSDLSDGLELLRALLERVDRRAHSARPRYRPLRWRRRREAHRCYRRFVPGRPTCR